MGCVRDVMGSFGIEHMSRFQSVEVVENVDAYIFNNEIRPGNRPVILKGLVTHWPCVIEASKGAEALAHYLSQFDIGRRAKVSVLPASEGGRFFYAKDLKGFNFENVERTVTQLARQLIETKERNAQAAYYMQALPIEVFLPGMAQQLPMPLIDPRVLPRFWIGNTIKTQTHYDLSENLACHIAGVKEFTLFPPDQIANLYPGPLLGGPGGVPVSLVDLDNPDFDTHPRFAKALECALSARLEPGDALYIPSLWWHHVHTQGPLNLLVNYWWDTTRPDAYPPLTGLLVSALSIKQMSPAQREAWRHWVNFYIFEADGDPVAHLPQHQHGFFDKNITPQQMAALKVLVRQNV